MYPHHTSVYNRTCANATYTSNGYEKCIGTGYNIHHPALYYMYRVSRERCNLTVLCMHSRDGRSKSCIGIHLVAYISSDPNFLAVSSADLLISSSELCNVKHIPMQLILDLVKI
jgi:hypothetical protein